MAGGTVSADQVQSQTQVSSTTIFISLLLPALLLWYVYWKLSRRHLYKLAEKLPGPKGLPFIGNALDLTGTSHIVFKTVTEKGKEFNQVIKLWAGPKLLVFLVDPRDIELVLSSQVYLEKSPEYRFFEPWLGQGLLISSGQKWRAHRKLIAPTFHLNVLKSFIELFNDNSRLVCKKMLALNGKTFDCHDYMSECTVEILLETAMGVSRKTQDQSGFDYAMAVMKMCDILHLRHTKLWLYPDFLFKLSKYSKLQVNLLDKIHSLTKKVIKSKKEAFSKGTRGTLATPEFIKPEEKQEKSKEEKKAETTVVEGLSFGQSAGLKDDLDVDDGMDVGEKKRLAFLDLLLESAENGAVISEQEIKEQVDTIMFEGHDTTVHDGWLTVCDSHNETKIIRGEAAGSSFFLSLMGIHQDIQDKVIEEIDSIFGDSDRPCTFQDTLEMKYLERCMMETLRMYPPVPVIARHMKQDLKLASGDYTVPKGSTVIVATYKLHRLESIYPNPDKFDPDNFLPERTANRHYYAFVPFSAGPRSCVGRKYAMLKLKVILSTILRQFRVYSDLDEKDFRLQADIILKREEGFQIRLEPRKPKSKQAAAS